MKQELFASRPLDSDPIDLRELKLAAEFVSRYLFESPQISWPLLSSRFGCKVFVKHENHLPTGSFKIRGGIWAIGQLTRTARSNGIIAATRGNHGQSVAFAAQEFGVPATVVVPLGNNPDKNRAIKAMGASLIEYGHDFDSALVHAQDVGDKEGLDFIPSFHRSLVQGVATYADELLRAIPDLEVVYVPIGLGSGIAGFLSAKEALGSTVEVVGVVSEKADAYALSWENRKSISTRKADTIADGLAVRVPSKLSLDYILGRVSRIIRVSEQQIVEATRIAITDTHNLVEPAGAASLAGLLAERHKNIGKRVGIILTGSNIDLDTLSKIVV